MMSKNQEAASSQILAKMTRKERRAYLKFEKKLQAEAWNHKWLTVEGWLSRFGDHLGSLINKLTTDDVGMIAAGGLGAFITYQARTETETTERRLVRYERSPAGEEIPIFEQVTVKKVDFPSAEVWALNLIGALLGYKLATAPSGLVAGASQVFGVAILSSMMIQAGLRGAVSSFRAPTAEEQAAAAAAFQRTGAV